MQQQQTQHQDSGFKGDWRYRDMSVWIATSVHLASSDWLLWRWTERKREKREIERDGYVYFQSVNWYGFHTYIETICLHALNVCGCHPQLFCHLLVYRVRTVSPTSSQMCHWIVIETSAASLYRRLQEYHLGGEVPQALLVENQWGWCGSVGVKWAVYMFSFIVCMHSCCVHFCKSRHGGVSKVGIAKRCPRCTGFPPFLQTINHKPDCK